MRSQESCTGQDPWKGAECPLSFPTCCPGPCTLWVTEALSSILGDFHELRYVWQHWVFVITQPGFEARQGNQTERPLFFLEDKPESLGVPRSWDGLGIQKVLLMFFDYEKTPMLRSFVLKTTEQQQTKIKDSVSINHCPRHVLFGHFFMSLSLNSFF